MGLVPGQDIQNGRYRIEKELGRGGFGTTFKAFHTLFKEHCVIKTPNDFLNYDPEYDKYLERFLREGRMLRKLCRHRHRHIVNVSDLFAEGKTHCLVMDYIEGESLLRRVQQQGKLPEAEALQYIVQMADALIQVHAAKIIHRDAHPDNIMIDGEGKAVLIDFGIAGELVPRTISTRMPGGSPFAPYEQMKQLFSPGEELKELCRKPTLDIYTLAASLYYAVTGEFPTPALDRKYDDVALVSPREYGVSQSVSDAIERGMAVEAKDHPQSMQELLSLLGKEPEPSVPPRYRRLKDLLAVQNWKEADRETARVMLQVAGREEGWLRVEDIDNFPCDDLRAIDQLWVKYSQGRFGFSVQKRIYQRLGGTREYDGEAWRAFGDAVGWRKKGEWLYYKDLTFSIDAKEGHLPVTSPGGGFGGRLVWGVVGVVPLLSSLAWRLVKCNL